MGRLFDIVIQGGRVLDGLGSDAETDVAIDGDRIAGVGDGFRGRRTIDAHGCVVTPGFIDVHTHTDFTLPVTPGAEAKLRQGVTTDVTGNCGFSPFPLAGTSDMVRGHGAFLEPELADRWATLAEYSAALADVAPAINVAPLIGHGAVRLAVMGEERRPPTASELDAMRALVAQAMDDRAFGISSGLRYVPSSYADVAELAALAEECGRRGGFYASHIRDESDGVRGAVAEAIEVGRRAGCAVQISHHKALGRRNWGAVDETLALLEEANACGCDVAVDMYPYTAGSTTLITLLPPAELRAGEEAVRRALAEPGFRARMADAVRTEAQFRPEEVLLGQVPSRPELNGRMVADVAAELTIDPAELILRLIESDGSQVVMVGFGMDEADVRRVLRHPTALIGSDGWVLKTDGPYAHPRNFGCFPRLLARYVRDERVLGLAEAVAKMTSRTAARLGLADRGMLAAGAAADVVVFDLEQVSEGGGFDAPHALPTGVVHVIVNGRVALAEGMPTGARGGRVLAPSRAGS